MFQPIYTNSFAKDIKLAQKRGKNIDKLKKIIELLVNKEPIPQKYRDHNLVGNFIGRRECHIEPDWLLIYKIDKDEIIFERTGTHSDLF
ncbi:Type II toxin-antitoxin system YafQ family toxin [Candidatus Megaera venefica]|uniref:Type II toxin-antitoxin system YafQ family toxin n=1 Tax=Candidatus Megaera venefica TaxID=2055910 RepID=A0ABU5NDJ8_9RICK|nr:type II toxin-antitoxin system YafQ family toxin [Candidatus Megaera venefica]MEA0971227.1 Type II toxin-antitoxin system YafQ family toxin [Candidatus Megaera venefica]